MTWKWIWKWTIIRLLRLNKGWFLWVRLRGLDLAWLVLLNNQKVFLILLKTQKMSRCPVNNHPKIKRKLFRLTKITRERVINLRLTSLKISRKNSRLMTWRRKNYLKESSISQNHCSVILKRKMIKKSRASKIWKINLKESTIKLISNPLVVISLVKLTNWSQWSTMKKLKRSNLRRKISRQSNRLPKSKWWRVPTNITCKLQSKTRSIN